MTSDRPYRKALSLDVAMKELTDHAGAQFDPAIVPVFVELLAQGAFPFFTAISVKSGQTVSVAA